MNLGQINQLTEKGIHRLMTSESNQFKPILQIINFQSQGNQNQIMKYNFFFRVTLGDGFAQSDRFVFMKSATILIEQSSIFQNKKYKNSTLFNQKITKLICNRIRNSQQLVLSLLFNKVLNNRLVFFQVQGYCCDYNEKNEAVYQNVQGNQNFPKNILNIQNNFRAQNQQQAAFLQKPNPQFAQNNIQIKQAQINNTFQQNQYTFTSNNQNKPVQYKNIANQTIVPLKALCPQSDNPKIKARVVSKSDIKTYKNQKGKEGKLFSIEIQDQHGTQIGGTFFNDAVDKFFENLIINQVYTFNRFTIKEQGPKFRKGNTDFQIIFENQTELSECETTELPSLQFNFKIDFTNISIILSSAVNSEVNLIAIVADEGEVIQKTLKSGDTKDYRQVSLYDYQQKLICLVNLQKQSLWGDYASLPFQKNKIIVGKSLRVSEFNNLSCNFSSSFYFNNFETNPFYKQLLSWHHQNPSVELEQQQQGVGQSILVNISEIQQNCSSLIDQSQKKYHDTMVYITYIKEDQKMFYDSCSNDKCKKKVFQIGDQWRCEACDIQLVEPNPRLIFQLRITDSTGSLYATIFDEFGRKILGDTDSKSIKHFVQTDQDGLKNIIESILVAFFLLINEQFQQLYRIRLCSNMESYNGEYRLKHTILSAMPILNFNEAIKDNLKVLEKYPK